MTHTFRYSYGLHKSVEDFIGRLGAGSTNALVIATNDTPYEAEENEFCFAIQMYTADGTFDELEEDDIVYGDDDDSANDLKLDAGGGGYPQLALIPGRFTKVVPADGTVVGLHVVKPISY